MGMKVYVVGEGLPYDVRFDVRKILADDTIRLLPDVKLFPIYCPACGRTQSNFFVHLGSRYGQVGELNCDSCGRLISVTDHDNRVDSIRFNQTEFFFPELYKTDWLYLKQLEEQQDISLNAVFEQYEGLHALSMDEARHLIEQAIGMRTSGNQEFITDTRITKLPITVNRWIELLSKCGVKNSYLENLQ
ncbi:hypothetical protein [Enterococcus larvae]|uniref:hypothetical protein n=1 Tax=Enterococcus larvae TaxID=2794352 RepID=UPI003F34660D